MLPHQATGEMLSAGGPGSAGTLALMSRYLSPAASRSALRRPPSAWTCDRWGGTRSAYLLAPEHAESAAAETRPGPSCRARAPARPVRRGGGEGRYRRAARLQIATPRARAG